MNTLRSVAILTGTSVALLGGVTGERPAQPAHRAEAPAAAPTPDAANPLLNLAPTPIGLAPDKCYPITESPAESSVQPATTAFSHLGSQVLHYLNARCADAKANNTPGVYVYEDPRQVSIEARSGSAGFGVNVGRTAMGELDTAAITSFKIQQGGLAINTVHDTIRGGWVVFSDRSVATELMSVEEVLGELQAGHEILSNDAAQTGVAIPDQHVTPQRTR
ncbi:MAG TPA: hypothetical protein VD735_01220 [Candidatus Saccharimonadales bacterium]|nr:hypothetical protein [Candidatus Saccharimonadales bacterium]